MPRAPAFLFDGFCLDRRDGLRRVPGGDREEAVVLGSRALDVLFALVERDGDLVARQALMDAAWPGLAVEELNLAVQISTLRRILDEGRGGGSRIQTVIGRGYRFLPTVTSRDADAIPGEPGIEPASTVPGRAEVARPRLSVVVLPFKNIGGDPGGDYLAETITDELTTDLSSWSFALVIAGKSAGTWAAGSMDVRLVGAELGVRYAIRGSVRGAAGSRGANQRKCATDRCGNGRPTVGRPVRD